MSRPRAPMSSSPASDRPRATDTSPHGSPVTLVRAVWIAVAALIVALFVAGPVDLSTLPSTVISNRWRKVLPLRNL